MENYANAQQIPFEDSEGAVSPWVAERLSNLMAEHGIPSRQQASVLSELCGLSLSQARRKLRGAMWSFGEVLAVTRRFGASLDQLFSDVPIAGVVGNSAGVDAFPAPLQDATFLMDSLSVPCRVRLGMQCSGTRGNGELLTASHPEGWLVGTCEALEERQAEHPFFYAEQILLMPETNKQRTRIAILDDEAGVSETLCDWFNAAGYEAAAFTSGEQLLAAGIGNHAAFIIDFMLGGGDSSQTVIKTIRQALPQAPIVLLTGKLRSGIASEAELTTLLRTSNVIFFEKPVRPSVVAASIETQLDNLASSRQD